MRRCHVSNAGDCPSPRVIQFRVGRPVILITTCNEDLAIHEQGRGVYVPKPANISHTSLAEEKIRQSESELRQILDVAPQHVYVLGPDPDTRLCF